MALSEAAGPVLPRTELWEPLPHVQALLLVPRCQSPNHQQAGTCLVCSLGCLSAHLELVGVGVDALGLLVHDGLDAVLTVLRGVQLRYSSTNRQYMSSGGTAGAAHVVDAAFRPHQRMLQISCTAAASNDAAGSSWWCVTAHATRSVQYAPPITSQSCRWT